MQVSLKNQEDTEYPPKESVNDCWAYSTWWPLVPGEAGVLSEVRLHTGDQAAGISAVAPSPQML